MEPSPTITISCDSLVEFEEDAAAKAQDEVEFVKDAAPASLGESAPAAADSIPPPHTSSQEPQA